MLKQLYPSLLSGRPGQALLMLRVFVGVAFLIHGYGKIVDIPAFAQEFGIPLWAAAAAAYTQFLAGALLIAGFAAPLAAGAIASTMAVATVTLMLRGEPFVSPHGHSWEASSFYLIASLSMVLLGPGAYSVDAVLLGRRGKQPSQPSA